nr:DUF6311 domain-containing protein [Neoroseomonas marina]
MVPDGGGRTAPVPPPPERDGGSRLAEWVGTLAAAALGCVIVAEAFGTNILPPSHTGWMLSGRIGPDPVQYWLGWTAFARDHWRWPPGANPGWGLELASSVFYADAIPILAFLFKLLRPVVEMPQYWGLWIYACGALQAVLAWKLMGLATSSPLARLSVAGLLVLQPALLGRLGGHFALGGQFLLLAGLWLCVTPGGGWRRMAAWAGLVGATCLVQAYLVPMVLALWAADWLARATDPLRRTGLAVLEAGAVPAAGVLALWAAGFFLLDAGFGGTWGGYGQMQLDLLAPLDGGDWSLFLPDTVTADHLDAGSSYLGLGAILVIGAGLLAWLLGPRGRLRRRWPLVAALLGLLVLAVSHRVMVGGQHVATLPLPAWIVGHADALRASERFVWPLFYAAILGAAAALVRRIGGRAAGVALCAAVLVQAADLRPGFARLQHFFIPQPAQLPLRLADPFWQQAARHYARVRVVPTGMQAPNWEEVAVYAMTLRLQTDAVYLARLDPEAVDAVNAAVGQRLESGDHEPRTFYVLGDETALARARAGMDPARDLLDRFDGRWVLAPGWREQVGGG